MVNAGLQILSISLSIYFNASLLAYSADMPVASLWAALHASLVIASFCSTGLSIRLRTLSMLQ